MPAVSQDLRDHSYYVLPTLPGEPVFGGVVVVRHEGTVLINPSPVARTTLDKTPHQLFDKADWVLITHREHARWGRLAANQVTARLAAPACGRPFLKVPVDRWLSDREQLVPGLTVYERDTSAEYGDCDWLLGNANPALPETWRDHEVLQLAQTWWRRLRRWARGGRR